MSQFIRKHVASSLLVSDTSTELSYILPSEAVKKGAFERLFQVCGAGCGGWGHEGPVEKMDMSLPAFRGTALPYFFAATGTQPGCTPSEQFWADGHNSGGGVPQGI